MERLTVAAGMAQKRVYQVRCCWVSKYLRIFLIHLLVNNFCSISENFWMIHTRTIFPSEMYFICVFFYVSRWLLSLVKVNGIYIKLKVSKEKWNGYQRRPKSPASFRCTRNVVRHRVTQLQRAWRQKVVALVTIRKHSIHSNSRFRIRKYCRTAMVRWSVIEVRQRLRAAALRVLWARRT